MELQGKKATHDFLSLYKNSSFPCRDPSPPEQELHPKTHDFLQPLEGKRKITPTTSPSVASVDHLLHGGIGKFSITHLTDEQATQYSAVIKPEWGTCLSGVNTVSSAAAASATVISTHDNCNSATHTGAAFTLWKEPPAKYKAASAPGGEQPHQWSSSQVRVSNGGSSLCSLLSGRGRSFREKRRAMDAGSKYGKGFTDEDEDDEEFGRKELTATVDRKSSQTNNDQKPTTPRSKHSATEQRRRSKINDRFQILRDLIPHSDQKRDKASFLLEVIEYIRFLQEKMQKHEPTFPECQENTKLKPWMNSHVALETTAYPSQALHNGPSAPGLVFSGDNSGPVVPRMLTHDQISLRTNNENSGLAHKTVFESELPQYGNNSGFIQPQQKQQKLVENTENVASQSQSQWLRQCSGSGGDVLSDQELTIDEGTISISSAYSQGLLNSLTEAFQNCGLDLSQARISVQINLRKRAFSRSISNPKDHEDPSANQAIGHSQIGNTIEELDLANKRHKSEKS